MEQAGYESVVLLPYANDWELGAIRNQVGHRSMFQTSCGRRDLSAWTYHDIRRPEIGGAEGMVGSDFFNVRGQ